MGNLLSRPNYTRLDKQHLTETGFDAYAQLACATRGASIKDVSDQFYGQAKNLLKKENPQSFLDQAEDTKDGWQVKRHLKTASVIVELGCTGSIVGFDVDTTGFDEASAPSTVMVEGFVKNDIEEKWIALLPNVSIKSNSHNFFKILPDPHIYSCIKLTSSPGGGISRLRCYGKVVPIWKDFGRQYNLASANLGARIVRWTDRKHADKPNILLDNGKTSRDGWLTPRSRKSPRNDFVVIQLATPGIIEAIILDTSTFEGNYPKNILVEGCYSNHVDPYKDPNVQWEDLLSESACFPNNQVLHSIPFETVVSHVRLTIYPDGGLQQIQVLGSISDPKVTAVPEKENEALLNEEKQTEKIEKELENEMRKDIDELLYPGQQIEYRSAESKRKHVELMENTEKKKQATERTKRVTRINQKQH